MKASTSASVSPSRKNPTRRSCAFTTHAAARVAPSMSAGLVTNMREL
jgi:hypothetical protein